MATAIRYPISGRRSSQRSATTRPARVRHFTAVVAGMSRVGYPTFIAYAWTGGALWVATFLTLGYFVGENWRQVAELIHRYVAYASVAAIAGALLWYVLWKRTKTRA